MLDVGCSCFQNDRPQSRHSHRRPGHPAFPGVARGEEGIVPRRRARTASPARCFIITCWNLRPPASRKFASSSSPARTRWCGAYLRGPGDDYLQRLEKYPALLREAEQMRGFERRVRFAVQHEQEGYGHAVFQTKNFAAGEMVLLVPRRPSFRGNDPFLALLANWRDIGQTARGRQKRFRCEPDFGRAN